MKKIIKELVLALTLCLVMSVSVCAKETKTFTVEEAVKYALDHNGDILKLKFQKDQLGYSISGVKDKRKMIEEIIDGCEAAGVSVVETLQGLGAYNFDSYLLRQKFTEKQLEKNKNLLNQSYVMRTELVKLSVENSYYKVLMKKISYDDAVRNYDVVSKQTEYGKIKLNYGTISEIDFKSLQISENAAKLTLINSEYEYEEAKMDFCDQLGLNYDIELNLTTPLEVKKVNIDTSNKKKTDLRDNDLAYIQSKNSYEDQEQKTKYAKAYYGTNADEYKNENLNLKSAEIDWANAQKTVERKILSTYNTLDVLEKTVQIYSDKKDLMNLALGIEKIRLNYQTATEADVINASVNYNTALNDYYDMVMNYNLIVSLFEKNIMV